MAHSYLPMPFRGSPTLLYFPHGHLFAPALAQLPGCSHLRHCPELADSRWVQLGVSRCLLPLTSGRGFLQWFASLSPELCPEHSLFFATLHSKRRLALIDELKEDEGIINQAEDKRREKRLEQAREAVKKAGGVLPKTLEMVRRSTQHSVKFIRWVASRLWQSDPWKLACAALATLYARL